MVGTLIVVGSSLGLVLKFRDPRLSKSYLFNFYLECSLLIINS